MSDIPSTELIFLNNIYETIISWQLKIYIKHLQMVIDIMKDKPTWKKQDLLILYFLYSY